MVTASPPAHDLPVLPRHVAIIMDGNGRWAAQRKLPRAAGHRRGAQSAKDAVMTALELGIEYLTLYSFSSENWNRSAEEVGDLMGLLRFTMQQEEKNLTKLGVRLRVIGDRERLPADILKTINGFESRSAENSRLTVIVALSYGSRAEITHAARRLAEQAANGEINPAAIDEAAIAANLYTSDIPDPDLLIRTSGELRISNFLLWQLAYSEFVFTDVFWPDFDKNAFTAALREYGSRERRFGGRLSA